MVRARAGLGLGWVRAIPNPNHRIGARVRVMVRVRVGTTVPTRPAPLEAARGFPMRVVVATLSKTKGVEELGSFVGAMHMPRENCFVCLERWSSHLAHGLRVRAKANLSPNPNPNPNPLGAVGWVVEALPHTRPPASADFLHSPESGAWSQCPHLG